MGRRMVRQCARCGVYIIGIALLLVLLVAGSALVWLITGPRAVPYFEDYITQYLEQVAPGYHVKVAEHQLSWEGFEHAIMLEAKDIRLFDEAHREALHVPHVSVGFNMLHLLYGRLMPKELFLHDAVLKIPQPIPDSLPMAQANQEHASPLVYHSVTRLLDLLGDTQQKGRALERLAIRNTQIVFTRPDGKTTFKWLIRNASGKVISSRDRNTLFAADIDSVLHGTPLPLRFESMLSQRGTMNMRLLFHDFEPHMFMSHVPQGVPYDIAFLRNSRVTLTGAVGVTLNADGALQLVDLHIDNARGSVALDTYYDSPLQLSFFSFKGSMSESFQLFNVEHFEADFDGPRLKLSGMANVDPVDTMVISDIEVANLPLAQLKTLWPASQAPDVRAWVLEHIHDGVIPHASGSLSLSSAKLAKGILDPKSVDASLHLENTRFRYHDSLPDITIPSARFDFSGDQLVVDIPNAQQADSSVRNVQVVVPFSSDPTARTTVSGYAKGPTTDLAAIQVAFTGSSVPLLGTDITTIEGQAETEFSLSIPMDVGAMHYSVQSKLSEVRLNGLLNRMDLSKGSLELNLTHDAVEVSGIALMNSIPTSVRLRQSFTDVVDEAFQAKYLFKSHVSMRELAQLGFPEVPFVKHKFDLGMAITEKNNGNIDFLVQADFVDADIALPVVSWEKPAGVAADLEIKASLSKDHSVEVHDFTLRSEGLEAIGSGHFSDSKQQLLVEQFTLGQTDIRIDFSSREHGYHLYLSGPSLDLATLPVSDMLRSSGKKGGMVDIRAAIKQVLLHNGVHLNNLTGNLYCAYSGCYTARLDAELQSGQFVQLDLQPSGQAGVQTLSVTSDNGGLLFKAFDLSNNVAGGKLTINATLTSDAEQRSMMKGAALLTDFHAIKTTVLAKLITVASLSTDIVDLLNGKGIPFSKFNIPFVWKDNVITLDKAKGHGGSIGISVDGSVFMAENRLDLSGNIIPAYGINNLLGKSSDVPIVGLVGDILTGGGEAVVATRYTIQGSFKEPDVTVNPLSMLTPGILRGIFE